MDTNPIKVWDGVVRLCHWGLASAFAVTYYTGEDYRDVHLAAGYAALFIIAVRVAWGFQGPRYARFRDFVRRPSATVSYLRSVLRGTAPRYVGHNPAGGVMIVLLLALIFLTGLSGVLMTTDYFWGSSALDDIHGWLAMLALACVTAHLAGVLVTAYKTRENLVWSMLSGRKRAPAHDDID